MILHLLSTYRRTALLCLFVAAASIAGAVVPPATRLPSHIKRVYIREFKNNSRWFGAQADLTLYVNDEFMLDGRLDVVQNERADVRLEGKIKSFNERPTGFGDDRFPLVSSLQLICVLELWDPYDSDRLVPMARFEVPTIIQYVSDPRRSISETETEAKDRLLRQAAKNIVLSVLQNRPLPERPIDGANKARYNQRRGTGKYEPEIVEPRFPKPTPVSAPASDDSGGQEVLEHIETITTTTATRRRSY